MSRPLIITDCDEVLLHMVVPFRDWLDEVHEVHFDLTNHGFVDALRQGVQVHTHTNGDEATELALDCLQQALSAAPVRDHRFTLQHCQMADQAQFRRMKALGMAVNLFANHHFYWGDEHRRMTLGPERAARFRGRLLQRLGRPAAPDAAAA